VVWAAFGRRSTLSVIINLILSMVNTICNDGFYDQVMQEADIKVLKASQICVNSEES
jgi:hypothetical protein